MNIVLKGREEAFEVFLAQPTLGDLLAARVINHHFHLLDRNVTILVDIGMIAQVCFKSILRFELILEESVDLD